MSRKKSFKSTSFRFTEIGSPVYLGRAAVETGTAAACWKAMLGLASGWSDALAVGVTSKISFLAELKCDAASPALTTGSAFTARGFISGRTTAKSTAFPASGVEASTGLAVDMAAEAARAEASELAPAGAKANGVVAAS